MPDVITSESRAAGTRTADSFRMEAPPNPERTTRRA